jgi:hypothetical protein
MKEAIFLSSSITSVRMASAWDSGRICVCGTNASESQCSIVIRCVFSANMARRKPQTPNPKPQRNPKHQAPRGRFPAPRSSGASLQPAVDTKVPWDLPLRNRRRRCREPSVTTVWSLAFHWGLGFGFSLGFGDWDLGFKGPPGFPSPGEQSCRAYFSFCVSLSSTTT